METLRSQGILIGPNLPGPVASAVSHSEQTSQNDNSSQGKTSDGASISPSLSTAPDGRRKPENKWKSTSASSIGSSGKSALPLNLISATNQQKVAQSVHIKQQLPLKLAGKLGGGSSGPSGGNSAGTIFGPTREGVQQVLPLKLSQSPDSKKSMQSSSGSGYQKLSSNSFSPTSKEESAHTHVRTGSSPAMMQNISPPSSSSDVPGDTTTKAGSVGAKAGRTNTYPKLPERFQRVTSPPGVAPQASEEDIIFF